MKMKHERALIATFGKKLLHAGLTRGTGGNLSIRCTSEQCVAISPSGLDYTVIKPVDVCVVDCGGECIEGRRKPSTELPMHLALYAAREDLHALVHTHSVYATTLSCLQKDLPAIHYTLGFAGTVVKCAPYATYGTGQLAQFAARYMKGCNAVLLANHGVLAGGATLQQAFYVAEMVEYCAELYCRALSIGRPKILPRSEMLNVGRKLRQYGK